MDNRFYDFTNEDDAEIAAAQTASTSRGHSAIKNHPGRAQLEPEAGGAGNGAGGKRRGSLNSTSTSPAASSLSEEKMKELPEVHNSPRKNGAQT